MKSIKKNNSRPSVYHCKLGCGEDDEREEDAEGVGDEERGEQLGEGEREVQLGAQQEPRSRDVTCNNSQNHGHTIHLSRQYYIRYFTSIPFAHL